MKVDVDKRKIENNQMLIANTLAKNCPMFVQGAPHKDGEY